MNPISANPVLGVFLNGIGAGCAAGTLPHGSGPVTLSIEIT